MFRGIDEIDWASMEHAYGPAHDVPDMLRGLASADPATRDYALDGMYGAVHHQGDVYDCTVAAIPFLFGLAVNTEVEDRDKVVELIASIGAPFDDELTGIDDADRSDPYGQANQAVRDGATLFARLLDDADPAVRRAAAKPLVRFTQEHRTAVALLTACLDVEQEPSVRVVLVEALGRAAVRFPDTSTDVVANLEALASGPLEPELKLAVLCELARCAPDNWASDVVDTVLDALYGRGEPPPPSVPDRPPTNTLVSHLRRLIPDDDAARLLRNLHKVLGSDVDARIRLLSGQLRVPHDGDRLQGLWMSSQLFRELRGDYADLVVLIGEQLASGDSRLRDAAANRLKELFGLARPAADHLADAVAEPVSWVVEQPNGEISLATPLVALGRAGDTRALPVLRSVLERPELPTGTCRVLAHLGDTARPLTPLLRSHLSIFANSGPDKQEPLGLVAAFEQLGDPGAEPLLHRLLDNLPGDQRERRWTIMRALQAIGTCGSTASVPVLQTFLADEESDLIAAKSLWHLTQDPGPIWTLLQGALAGGADADPYRVRQAAELAGEMTESAADLLPLLDHASKSSDLWLPTIAACSISRITHQIDSTEPLLRRAWAVHPHQRHTITKLLADLGPAGTAIHDLVREELATPERYRWRSGGWSGDDIYLDELLLRRCRQVLDQAT